MISKPIPIADSSVFTPYIGYQFIRIFGDSGLDRSDAGHRRAWLLQLPGSKSAGRHGGSGHRQGHHATGTASGPPYNGQPACGSGTSKDGSPDDLNNTKIFPKTRITRHRLVAGLSWRYEMVTIGGQFITDLIDPGTANSGEEATALSAVGRQNTIAIQVGTAF